MSNKLNSEVLKKLNEKLSELNEGSEVCFNYDVDADLEEFINELKALNEGQNNSQL